MQKTKQILNIFVNLHIIYLSSYLSMKSPKTLILLSFALLFSCSKVLPPTPYGACPTPQQVAWQQMEINMFCHFGPNTFSDVEWGNGTEAEDLFNPTSLDCRQWASVAKQAGMCGIIITAKHHDGFCLWPNPHSTHTVAQSSWRDGQGDVLRELSEACNAAGIKMGVYISPWDRNAPTYGTPSYNETFRLTLEDALSRYGNIFEQWFDGANGEGPNGKKQTYDWTLFNATVARLQPLALIFSDIGPGCRWVGNESGSAGETCWSTLNTEGFYPGAGSPSVDTLNRGNIHGSHWIPAETDVSIRTGWFHHENEHPKTVEELLNIYYTSVGRNSLLLLNVPPDRRGLIAAEDSLRLIEFRKALDKIFSVDLAQKASIVASNTRGGKRCRTYKTANLTDGNYNTYWTTDDSVTSPTLTMTFKEAVTFNRILLQEYIPLGQRVAAFSIEYQSTDGSWHPLATATTIGYKRILLTPTVTTNAIRIHIEEAFACPVINRVGLFLDTITE